MIPLRPPRPLGRLPLLAALLLPALPIPPAPLHAQLPPTGTVTVSVRSDGAPVAGARVEAGGVAAVTRRDGTVELTLPAGEVRLEVRRFGFQTATAELHLPAGAALVVAVELQPDALEVEGVVVTSLRTRRRVQDEPVRVEVLDREEIQEKMLMTPGNIAMLLNETGGLRVQVTSPALGAANIRVHGMRGRYTQLLADGLPLYGGQAGSLGLLQIPPADLGQVEVIKGAASALYGGSALGGVVNLVSRTPDDEPEAELLLNATTHGGQDLVGYASGPLTEGWGYSLLGGAHRQLRKDLDGRGWADVPAHRRWSVRPRLFWTGSEGASAFLTLGGMTERREGGTVAGGGVPGGGVVPQALDTDRLDAGLTARFPVGEGVVLEFRGSGMSQEHHHTFGEVEEEDRHHTGFAEVNLSGSVGPHAWVVGGALQRDGYRSRTFPDFDYTHSTPALFAQGELVRSRELSASVSARWDRHSAYGSQVSPRVAVLYRPGPWTVRGSVGGGFFAPTPFVEEIEAAGLSRLAPPEGLQAERARTASLDLGRAAGRLELGATLFASGVEGAVRLVPEAVAGDVDPPGVRLVNAPGTTRTLGAELLVRARWDDLSLTGSWVVVESTEPGAFGEGRQAVPLTPRHTAGVVAMWEDHDRGLLGVEAYYTGAQPLEDNPFRSRGRPHLHLGVLGEVRRGALGLFLNAENLLNVRQTRWDPLLREVRAPDGRWTVDAWAPLEGFVLNGGVRIQLGGGH